MVVKVYKGLGKPVVYFGINGDVFPYLVLFWISSVIIAVAAGALISDVTGAVVFILLVFSGYFAASLFQEKELWELQSKATISLKFLGFSS